MGPIFLLSYAAKMQKLLKLSKFYWVADCISRNN